MIQPFQKNSRPLRENFAELCCAYSFSGGDNMLQKNWNYLWISPKYFFVCQDFKESFPFSLILRFPTKSENSIINLS